MACLSAVVQHMCAALFFLQDMLDDLGQLTSLTGLSFLGLEMSVPTWRDDAYDASESFHNLCRGFESLADTADVRHSDGTAAWTFTSKVSKACP